ncbi:MAG: hypothetical protein EOP48_32400, partial [Sphingobacteriales bacterium]
VRLSGQDVQRGTFSHRHAVLHDAETNLSYSSLDFIQDDDRLENNRRYPGDNCRIEYIRILLGESRIIHNGNDITILTGLVNENTDPCSIIFSVKRNDSLIFAAASFYKKEGIEKGHYEVKIIIPKYLLNPGYHSLDIMIVDRTGNFKSLLFVESALTFNVEDDMCRRGEKYMKGWDGAISPILPIEWSKTV